MIGVLHAPCVLCYASLHFRRTTRHGVTSGCLFMHLGICIIRSKGFNSPSARHGETVLHAPCVLCYAPLHFRRTTRNDVTSGRLFMRLCNCIMRSKGINRPLARHGETVLHAPYILCHASCAWLLVILHPLHERPSERDYAEASMCCDLNIGMSYKPLQRTHYPAFWQQHSPSNLFILLPFTHIHLYCTDIFPHQHVQPTRTQNIYRC
jgi:hypothetical protein